MRRTVITIILLVWLSMIVVGCTPEYEEPNIDVKRIEVSLHLGVRHLMGGGSAGVDSESPIGLMLSELGLPLQAGDVLFYSPEGVRRGDLMKGQIQIPSDWGTMFVIVFPGDSASLQVDLRCGGLSWDSESHTVKVKEGTEARVDSLVYIYRSGRWATHDAVGQ